WNEREDDYASVAFWYQAGKPTFVARAPHARERALPSLDAVIAKGRDFVDAKFHGTGDAIAQPLELYPEPQMLYQPATNSDAWIEIPFTVTNKLPYRLLLNLTKSYDFGQYQAFLNGVKLGPKIDLYNAKVVNEEVHLLDFWPEPGQYRLRLECV